MDTTTVTVEIPTSLYHQLQALARESQTDLVHMIALLLERDVGQIRSWQESWDAFCDLVQQEGGLCVDGTSEEIVDHMRQTRQAIFEEEYAHLY